MTLDARTSPKPAKCLTLPPASSGAESAKANSSARRPLVRPLTRRAIPESLPLLPDAAPAVPVALLPGLTYLGLVLADGPQTIGALAARTGQSPKWLRKHLVAGRAAGLFTERRQRHNCGVWAAGGSFPVGKTAALFHPSL